MDCLGSGHHGYLKAAPVPIKPLTEVAAGSRIIVDANVFIYAVNRTSRQCAQFLERCANSDVHGVTTFDALAEANHRLMLEESPKRHDLPRG
jgi:tryptophan synthase alpha subunit